MALEFLLRYHERTGTEAALAMAEATCDAMARGGMYDQLGGGFARYSVDATWTVPHFEKMLYDNALLAAVYTHLWRRTGSALARRVAEETCDFMVRELGTREGGLAASLDADSDGAEGAFYVWTPDQLREVLGEEDGEFAAVAFGVTVAGTFEHGSSVLQRRAEPSQHERFDRIRGILLTAREGRTVPGRDDKVVAAWNGMAIAALAERGRAVRQAGPGGRRRERGPAAGLRALPRRADRQDVTGRRRRAECRAARGLRLRGRRAARAVRRDRAA